MQSKMPIGLANVIGLLFIGLCFSMALAAQDAAGERDPASEKTKAEWAARYVRANARKSSGMLISTLGAGVLAGGVWAYATRFDTVTVDGQSFMAIGPSGSNLVQEPSIVLKVENSAKRKFAIGTLVAGGAITVWGLVRTQGASTQIRTIEEERRNWGIVSFAPTRRGFMVAYQRTF